MNIARIPARACAIVAALAVPLAAAGMGSADHDLAKDMATTVYGVAYTGPTVDRCRDGSEAGKSCSGGREPAATAAPDPRCAAGRGQAPAPCDGLPRTR